ncbi:MAG TPA: META domain-containing protein [Moraxellaceae bacterium]
MKTRTALMALCVSAAALTGCSSTPLKTPEQIAAARQTLNGSWTLTKASDIAEIPSSILLTLHPDTAKDSDKLNVSGFSGVNHFVGSATISWSDQHLVFGALATTRKMGPEPRMKFETELLKQLGEVGNFKLQGDTLTLKTLAGNTLTFAKGAQ